MMNNFIVRIIVTRFSPYAGKYNFSCSNDIPITDDSRPNGLLIFCSSKLLPSPKQPPLVLTLQQSLK